MAVTPDEMAVTPDETAVTPDETAAGLPRARRRAWPRLAAWCVSAGKTDK
jgi:hypothetical protein